MGVLSIAKRVAASKLAGSVPKVFFLRKWFAPSSIALFLLPSLLKLIANEVLKRLPGYTGRVDKFSVSALEGTATIRRLQLNKGSDHTSDPFILVEQITVKIRWKDLLFGRLVGVVKLLEPVLFLEPTMLTGASVGGAPESDWRQKIASLPPMLFESIRIVDGKIFATVPEMDGGGLAVQGIQATIRNLANKAKPPAVQRAFVTGQATVMAGGQLTFSAEGLPLAEMPTFNVDLSLKNLDLTEFKNLIRRHTGSDIESGQLHLAAEAAAADGRITGYAKPVVAELKLKPIEGLTITDAVKAKFIRGGIEFLKNRNSEDVATKIEFSGALNDLNVGVAQTIFKIVKNAFADAIRPTLERSVGFGSVDENGTVRRPLLVRVGGVVKEAAKKWLDDEALRMSAALAYYTAFSIAPLLLLSIALAGLVFGREAAQGQILDQVNGLVGNQNAATIQSMIQTSSNQSVGIVATIIGVITLLFGASGVLSELTDGLNRVWGTRDLGGIKAVVTRRAKLFGMVLGIGFLLLVSLVVSAALAAVGAKVHGLLPAPESVLQLLNFAVSFAVVTALFAALYKFLPNTRIQWKDVWIGAGVTSFLFGIGNLALGIYLGKAAFASAYGAASSVMILLLWFFYSGLIFYYGAEFTKVYADTFGSKRSNPQSS